MVSGSGPTVFGLFAGADGVAAAAGPPSGCARAIRARSRPQPVEAGFAAVRPVRDNRTR